MTSTTGGDAWGRHSDIVGQLGVQRRFCRRAADALWTPSVRVGAEKDAGVEEAGRSVGTKRCHQGPQA